MSQESLAIKEIWQKNSITLGIKWSDNQEFLYDVRTLRALCPCAGCQAQRPANELLEQVRPKTITSVGSYALKIDFNDGHNTGIYSFEFLKDLGEQQKKQG